jgi:uncharacterized protein YuzE
MISNCEYHPKEDIFYINRNDSNKEILGSFPIGNLVFDVDTSGKIVGLEIDNASELFGVTPEIIMEAKEANLGTTIQKIPNGNALIIHFSINLGIKNYEYSYVLSQNKIPILA